MDSLHELLGDKVQDMFAPYPLYKDLNDFLRQQEENSMIVVIYGYYFLILQLNSNIIPCMSNADYVTNQDIMLLLAKRIKEYRLAARMSPKGNGGEIRCESCYYKPF